MLLPSSKYDMYVVRGTTAMFSIKIKLSSGGYKHLETGEKLIFGVKKDPDDTGYIIGPKILTSANLISGTDAYALTLSPSDTINLDHTTLRDPYIYDIGLSTNSDTVYRTVIPSSSFHLVANVTNLSAIPAI